MTRWSVKPQDVRHAETAHHAAHAPHHAPAPQRASTWRGPFGSSVFRAGRGPLSSAPRPPHNLRPRRPAQQAAESEHVQTQQDPFAAGDHDVDDEARRAAVQPSAAGDARQGGDKQRQDDERRLVARLLSRERPLESRLDAWAGRACGTHADERRPSTAVARAIESAVALAGALRRCIVRSAAADPAELPGQAIQARVAGSYIAAAAPRGAFAALARVKAVLLDPATAPPREERAAARGEAQENRHLLLPLLLLNLDRPRTPVQRSAACDRLDLIAFGPGAQRAFAARRTRPEEHDDEP